MKWLRLLEKDYGQENTGKIRAAAQRRHPPFAGGYFARAKSAGLRAARAFRRRAEAHVGVVQSCVRRGARREMISEAEQRARQKSARQVGRFCRDWDSISAIGVEFELLGGDEPCGEGIEDPRPLL